MGTAVKKQPTVAGHPNVLTVDGGLTSETDKIHAIAFHFRKIMETLGLDLEDDSLKGTPARIAKMYVSEIFSGLDRNAFPVISLFKNAYQYREMLIERDIQVYSYCEHHFAPFVGKAHVAYFPAERVIGLSKLNRIVKYFASRPQVQERLTTDIAKCLKEILETEDIAIVIEARHFCVAARGVEDSASATVTSHLGGKFSLQENRTSFYAALRERPL